MIKPNSPSEITPVYLPQYLSAHFYLSSSIEFSSISFQIKPPKWLVDKNNGTENPLFKLGWLDVQQQIDFDTAVMVRKTLNKTAPSHFSEMFQEMRSVHNHDTRGSRCGLFPTHCNLKTGQRSFSHYGCNVRNKIDRDVQEITNVECFKKNLKKSYLKK